MGEEARSCRYKRISFGGLPHPPVGMERAHVTDYLTDADQEIPDYVSARG